MAPDECRKIDKTCEIDQIRRNAYAKTNHAPNINMFQQDNAGEMSKMLVSEYAEEQQYLQQMEALYLSRKFVADLKLSVLKAEKEATTRVADHTDRIDLTHIDALMRSFSRDDDYEDIMNLYDVSDAKRWISAKRLLSGSAKVYITHVAPLTWDLLKTELLKVFKQKLTAWDVGKR